jgi:hypothetical protein
MTMYALVSPGGSPGVTTTALALALSWSRPVVIAECDPACGDIAAGLFAGHLNAPRGLIGLALEAGRGAVGLAAELEAQLAPLAGAGRARFLAGLTDPRQAPGLNAAWPVIARALASHPAGVLADCGRLDAGGGQPLSVLTESAAVIMVLRPSLRQVAAASPRIEMLMQLLGGQPRVGLLLIGDGAIARRDIARTLGVPVVASLPLDDRSAAVLSDGAGRRAGLSSRPLLRASRAAGAELAQFAVGVTHSDPAAVPAGSRR